MTKLKPCPFCGGEAEIIEDQPHMLCILGFQIQCCVVETSWFNTKQEAIDAWNTRADGWISVDDRLPEKSGMVQAVKNRCVPRTVAFNSKYRVFELGGNIFECTHWQPLPEPPKGEKE